MSMKKIRKSLSIILSAAMIFSCMPTAQAYGMDGGSNGVVEESASGAEGEEFEEVRDAEAPDALASDDLSAAVEEDVAGDYAPAEESTDAVSDDSAGGNVPVSTNQTFTYDLEQVKSGVFTSEDGVVEINAFGSNQTGGHGINFSSDKADTIKVRVSGNVRIGIRDCIYGNDIAFSVTDEYGVVSGTFALQKPGVEKETSWYTYRGRENTLTFTRISGGVAYLHSIVLDYSGELDTGDAYIAKSFDGSVEINRTAGLRAHIFRASDDTEVDAVEAVDEELYTLNSSVTGKVGVNRVQDNLIWTDGRTLVITPHNDENAYPVLEPGTEYYVTLDDGLVKVGGQNVSLVKGDWNFTTTSPKGLNITHVINVGPNDDFNTLTGAFNYLRKNEAKGDWTIKVGSGIYHERPCYVGTANITIIGRSRTGEFGRDTRFTWKNVNDWTDGGARGRSTFLVQGGGDMNLIGISMENTFDRAADNGSSVVQAETLAFDSSGELFAYDCGFYSHQDTLYIGRAGNRSWFYKCRIEGDVDYIWGYSGVCLLEECSLRCIYDPAKAGNTSYIIASRTQMDSAANAGANKGFVLMNSTVEIDDGVWVCYARNSGAETNAAIINNVFLSGDGSSKGDVIGELYGSKPTYEITDDMGDFVVGYMDGDNYTDAAKTIKIDTADRLDGCGALSARMENREYSGRYVILNRGYDMTSASFKTASEIWDTDALAEELGVTVTADDSDKQIFVEPMAVKNLIGGVSVNYAAYDVKGMDITDLVAWSVSEEDENDPGATGNTTAVDAAMDSAAAGRLITKPLTRSTVEVKAALGSKSDVGYCSVIPSYVPADTVQLELVTGYMNLYGTKELHGSLSCSTNDQDEVTSKKVTWTSPDPDKVLLYDPKSRTFAESVTTDDCNVTVYAVGSGKTTITATTVDGGRDTVEINVYADQMEWTPFVAGVLVNTDVQNGRWGTFNGMLIDAVTNNRKNEQTAKSAMKAGNTSMQTRNMVMNIPSDKDATLVVTLDSVPDKVATANTADSLNYKGLYADGTDIEWDNSNLTYTVHYKAADGQTASITDPENDARISENNKMSANVGCVTGSYPDNLSIDAGIDKTELSKAQYIRLAFGSSDVKVMSYVLTQAGHVEQEDVNDDSYTAASHKVRIVLDRDTIRVLKVPADSIVRIYHYYTDNNNALKISIGDKSYLIERPEGRKFTTVTPESGTAVTSDTDIMITTSPTGESVSGNAGKTVWIVGNATIRSYDTIDNYYYPRYGYGSQLAEFIDDTYIIKNFAMTARSAKSFRELSLEKSGCKEYYDRIVEEIKPGDVLIVGFGHHDETEDERFLSAAGGADSDFAQYLYTYYVKMAEDKGAKVILCTPIVRRDGSVSINGKYSGSYIHDQTSKGNGDYAEAIRELGAKKNVFVADLTAITRQRWEELGPDSAYYHAWAGGKPAIADDPGSGIVGNPDTVDNMYLNLFGAKWVAYKLVQAASKEGGPFEGCVRSGITKPSKEKDLVPYAPYIENYRYYTPPTRTSSIWPEFINEDGVVFNGSIFGLIGGEFKCNENYNTVAVDNASHTVFLENAGTEGGSATKIQADNRADGFLMYYLRLPADVNFRLTAKAEVNANSKADGKVDNQSAFGLMARDDMYIDEQNEALISDYVVAGALGTQYNCFCNNNGLKRGKDSISDNEIALGKTYDLSLSKNDDGYICRLGDYPVQSDGYDFRLTDIDNKYQYVGFFVTRKYAATFSDVKLLVQNTKGEFVIPGSDDDDVSGIGSTSDPVDSEDEIQFGDAYISKSFGFGSDVEINRAAGLEAHIFRASDDVEVDAVAAADEKLYMGNSSAPGKVGLNKVGDNLIWTDGSTLVITPHNDEEGYPVLKPGTEYYVTLDEGLVQVNGQSVSVSKGDWTFKTTASKNLAAARTLKVGHGTGFDFKTLTGAFNYMRKNEAEGDWTIYVDKGVYHERPFYYGNASITIIGDSEEGDRGNDVRFTWKNVNDWSDGGARGRSTFLVQGDGDMNMIGISMVNTFDRTADKGGSAAQAETLAFDGSGKLFVYDCGFYSHQDTLYIGKAGNRSWFYKSYIEGDVDFLWGYPGVCLFEECELRCVYDPARAGNASAHLIASRTQMDSTANAGSNKGFVLMNSKVLLDDNVIVNYARNSGSDSNAAIINNVFLSGDGDSKGYVNSTLYGSCPGYMITDKNGDLVVGYMDGDNYTDAARTEKIDTSKRLSGCGALVPRIENREYSGRFVILNRGYDLTTEKFVTAKEIWDTDKLAAELGVMTTADDSDEQIYVEPVAVKDLISGATVDYVAYDVRGKDITDVVTWSVSEEDENDPGATGNTTAVDAAMDSDAAGRLITKPLTRSKIEVKAAMGSKSDVGYCSVLPSYVPADTVRLELVTGYMNLYGTKELHGSLSCSTNDQDEVTSKEVTWTTGDPDKVLLYDPESKTFARSVTTENCNVTLYAAGSGDAKITAETLDGGMDTVEINVYEDQMEWTPFVAGVLVNTDVQSGRWGTFNGMLIDAYTNNRENGVTAKVTMKNGGYDRMLTRNMVMNIPSDKDATLKVTLDSAPDIVATAENADSLNYKGIYADGDRIKWDADTLTYTVNYNKAADAQAASITDPENDTRTTDNTSSPRANVGSDDKNLYPGNLSIDAGIDKSELAKEQYIRLEFGSRDVYVRRYVLTQTGHKDVADVKDGGFNAPAYEITMVVDRKPYSDKFEVSGYNISISYTNDGTTVKGTVGDVPFEVVIPEERVVASITPDSGTEVTDNTEISITTKEKEVTELSTITEKGEFLTEDFYTAAVASDKMDETILSKDGKIVFVSSKKASGAVKSKVDVDTAAQSFADENDKIAMLDEATEETHSAAVNLQASLFTTGDTPAYFEFTTDKAGLLKVYWKSSSGSDPKTIGLRKVDKDGKTVGSATEGIAGVDDITGGLARAFSTEDTAKKYQWINTFFIPEAGTYRFGATNGGGKIYRMIVELTGSETDIGKDSSTSIKVDDSSSSIKEDYTSSSLKPDDASSSARAEESSSSSKTDDASSSSKAEESSSSAKIDDTSSSAKDEGSGSSAKTDNSSSTSKPDDSSSSSKADDTVSGDIVPDKDDSSSSIAKDDEGSSSEKPDDVGSSTKTNDSSSTSKADDAGSSAKAESSSMAVKPDTSSSQKPEDSSSDNTQKDSTSSSVRDAKDAVSDSSYSETTSKKGEDSKTYDIAVTMDDYIYDGKPKKPEISITDEEGRLLVEGTDYTVVFKNNKNANLVFNDETGEFVPGNAAKQPTYIVKFKGTFKSSKQITGTFDIAPYPIAFAQLIPKKDVISVKKYRKVNFLKSAIVNIDGKNKKLSTTKDIDVNRLYIECMSGEHEGERYSLANSAKAPAGDYLIIAYGRGNYCGYVMDGGFTLKRK